MDYRLCALLTILTSSAILKACYIEEVDDDQYDSDYVYYQKTKIVSHEPYPYPPLTEIPTHSDDQSKKSNAEASSRMKDTCREKYRRLGIADTDLNVVRSPHCTRGACQSQPISLQYALAEDLGSQWAFIQVADNPYFASSGHYTSTVMTGYRANTGESAASVLALPPGHYYVRAFLTEPETSPAAKPTTTKTNINVTSQTTGLIVPEIADVNCPDPMFLHLDQRVINPDTELETGSHLRLGISTKEQNIDSLNADRSVHIGLYKGDDFSYQPLHTWSFKAASLLTQGQEGRTEFVTPELPIREYYIMAYHDSNGSGYHDDGELAGWVKDSDGFPKPINIKKDQVRLLELILDHNALKPD